MSGPNEHKTVQARILEYAEAIGWAFVSQKEVEQRRGLNSRTLFFEDLLDAKVREFNPRYAEAEGALPGNFWHLHTDIYGNQEFVEHLRNRGKFFDHEEKRERDLILKQKRRLRKFPETASRQGFPSPGRFIVRTALLSNPNSHEL